MGYKPVRKSASAPHPLGWFLFCISGYEVTESEFKGTKTPRLKFKVESSERKEDGERFVLSVWTGRDIVDDERCKLKQLIEACGMDCDEMEDCDELTGRLFAGKVTQPDSKEAFPVISQFDTKDRIRPSKAKREWEDVFEKE